MLKLTDLFHLEPDEEQAIPDEPMKPDEALALSFGILTRGDKEVAESIESCLADTKLYFSSRNELLDQRGLAYSAQAEPWLHVIAAVESALQKGYLKELRPKSTADEFTSALKKLLAAVKIEFSPDRLAFDPQKNLAAWTRLFNEYAGQSGITLYFIELYGESRVMGAARISDYAEAAEIVGFAGIRITCRPN